MIVFCISCSQLFCLQIGSLLIIGLATMMLENWKENLVSDVIFFAGALEIGYIFYATLSFRFAKVTPCRHLAIECCLIEPGVHLCITLDCFESSVRSLCFAMVAPSLFSRRPQQACKGWHLTFNGRGVSYHMIQRTRCFLSHDSYHLPG